MFNTVLMAGHHVVLSGRPLLIINSVSIKDILQCVYGLFFCFFFLRNRNRENFYEIHEPVYTRL